MALTFEWDDRKAKGNLKKHGVSFEEAATAFGDERSITIYDPDHSTVEEDRYMLLGLSHRNRLLVVVHVARKDNMRVISARQGTVNERKTYEEG